VNYATSHALLVFALVGCASSEPAKPDYAAELRSRGVWGECPDGAAPWYEMPYTARLYNGRPFEAADGAIANTFVCRGFMRFDGAVAPPAEVQWLMWSAIADAERRSTAILLTPTHPVSSPTVICTTLSSLLNQTLRRELASSPARVYVALQSAFAELESGELLIKDLGPTSHVWPRPDNRPWLSPNESLVQCEGTTPNKTVTP